MDSEHSHLIETARLVIARLERMSADSFWAHQASGARGSLLRALDLYESGKAAGPRAIYHIQRLIDLGYWLLENAAREIEVPEEK